MGIESSQEQGRLILVDGKFLRFVSMILTRASPLSHMLTKVIMNGILFYFISYLCGRPGEYLLPYCFQEV
jgi:hypothetical protein